MARATKAESENSDSSCRGRIDQQEFSIELWKQVDIPSICLIEKKSFDDPWSEQSFTDLFNLDHIKGYVLKVKDKILAYSIVAFLPDEIEILNVSVASPSQSKGLGQTILSEIHAQAYKMKIKRSFLEVRRSNHKAIHLYTKLGYAHIATRSRYYSNGEDALIMECTLKKGTKGKK